MEAVHATMSVKTGGNPGGGTFGSKEELQVQMEHIGTDVGKLEYCNVIR